MNIYYLRVEDIFVKNVEIFWCNIIIFVPNVFLFGDLK